MPRTPRASSDAPRTSAPASPPRTQRPDPEAWHLALGLADGDAARLTVSGDGRTIVVRNS